MMGRGGKLEVKGGAEKEVEFSGCSGGQCGFSVQAA